LGDTRDAQWYTNKELFEMVQELREEVAPLRMELRTTTEAVRRYNSLRERLDETERKLAAHLATGAGQASVARGIREWGGWIVAVISLLVALAGKI
jgi:hypothetical protein